MGGGHVCSLGSGCARVRAVRPTAAVVTPSLKPAGRGGSGAEQAEGTARDAPDRAARDRARIRGLPRREAGRGHDPRRAESVICTTGLPYGGRAFAWTSPQAGRGRDVAPRPADSGRTSGPARGPRPPQGVDDKATLGPWRGETSPRRRAPGRPTHRQGSRHQVGPSAGSGHGRRSPHGTTAFTRLPHISPSLSLHPSRGPRDDPQRPERTTSSRPPSPPNEAPRKLPARRPTPHRTGPQLPSVAHAFLALSSTQPPAPASYGAPGEPHPYVASAASDTVLGPNNAVGRATTLPEGPTVPGTADTSRSPDRGREDRALQPAVPRASPV